MTELEPAVLASGDGELPSAVQKRGNLFSLLGDEPQNPQIYPTEPITDNVKETPD